MNLRNFESNIKSQYGEDGVIAEIFNRIGNDNKVCVEFGAWDGTHLSNTWNLWHNLNWGAYLIEGDPAKAKVLEKAVEAFPNVHAIEAYVMPEGENSLDVILSRQNVPKDLDLLSIDIDGDDYYIFQNLNNFRPRVIIIEFNPTVPPHLEMVQARGEYMGASALSLVKLGESKGYKAVYITDVNLFFVTNDIFDLGSFEILDLDKCFKANYLVNIITSFDGIPFLTGDLKYRLGVPLPSEPVSELNIKSVFSSLKRKKGKVSPKIPKFKSPLTYMPVNIFKRRENN
jgi:hypothetical protein